MKTLLKTILALATFVILAATTVQAENQKKMIVALKTSDFELTETDISSLAVGEAQTIETESGRVIDILRTVDGAEIYVDGELLEMNFDDDALHENHMVSKHVFIHKEIELSCTDDEEGTSCSDKTIWVSDNGDIDLEEIHEKHSSGNAHKVIVIRKEIITED